MRVSLTRLCANDKTCLDAGIIHTGTIEAFLTSCPSLSTLRESLMKQLSNEVCSLDPYISGIIYECIMEDPSQFFLDCSTMSRVIELVQQYGEDILSLLLKFNRNYCFLLHKKRLEILKDKS